MERILEIIKNNGNRFDAKVIAGSNVDRLYLENNVIKIKVKEIPENGRANRAVVKLISKELGIPQKNIEIIRGGKSSTKTIGVIL